MVFLTDSKVLLIGPMMSLIKRIPALIALKPPTTVLTSGLTKNLMTWKVVLNTCPSILMPFLASGLARNSESFVIPLKTASAAGRTRIFSRLPKIFMFSEKSLVSLAVLLIVSPRSKAFRNSSRLNLPCLIASAMSAPARLPNTSIARLIFWTLFRFPPGPSRSII